MATWHDYERCGWSWATGWSATHGGYYAQAWRNLPKPFRAGGRRYFRECLTEHGSTIDEATTNLWQRLDGLEERENDHERT